MKTAARSITLVLVGVNASFASQSALVSSQVTERGRNYEVVHVTRQTTDNAGAVTLISGHYTLLRSGLHRRDTLGAWVECQPVVQAYENSIICTGAAYCVILNRNLNTDGAVDFETSDGQRVVSHPLSIGFYDPETGRSVLLAQVKDSQGEVVSSNTIHYADAFEGNGIKASVTYRYGLGAWHQDAIFNEWPQSLTPEAFQMGEKTRIEVMTEILESPAPSVEVHYLKRETDATKRQRMVEPDLEDETIRYGTEMALRLGRAFQSETNHSPFVGIPVGKRLLNVEDRTLLVEAVEWNRATKELVKVLKTAALSPGSMPGAQPRRQLPERRMARIESLPFESRLAEVSRSSPVTKRFAANNTGDGFVIDYVWVSNEEDYTFHANETYLVDDNYYIENVTFEDRAHIKYFPAASLVLSGTLDWPESGAAVFTSKDDNSVGEAVGSNSPSQYAAPALGLEYYGDDFDIEHVDIRYATVGIYIISDGEVDSVQMSRFAHCSTGIIFEDTYGIIDTVIFCDVDYPYELYNDGSIETDSLMDCTSDTDSDGLPDNWEFQYFGSFSPTPAGDPDGDGLTNLLEYQNGFDPTDPDTDDDGLGDLQEYEVSFNVLVNDPDQDYGNEQNSQFETSCAVLGSNVVVAWVDSNEGVYGLGGEPSYLTNRTPRFVSYAVSTDGGVTFEDKGLPPLAREGAPTNDDGDAGDPVLAVDRVSETVYLVGTSPRNQGSWGIPLWKSTDGGVTFTNPVIVLDGITNSDKPWIAVDDWPGTGQHDVYVMCTGSTNPAAQKGLWLGVSTNGNGSGWTNPPIAVRETDGTNVKAVNSPIIQIAPDHAANVFWYERAGVSPQFTNWLKMCQVRNRGTELGEVQTIRQLVTTNDVNGNLELLRSNTAATNDFFNAWPFPVPAINPVETNHLYVAFADKGTNANDRADIFFVSSADGGTNWTTPVRVNTDTTTNDQWMPVLAVKPDGEQLFIAWYDRRSDSNNSLIELYGRWGAIGTNGSVSLETEFTISTTNFPPVFAGTDTNNSADGHYDPAYPPYGVNLSWYYDEWPTNSSVVVLATGYRSHVGEYNSTFAAGQYVYVTWTDYRLTAAEPLYPRNQSDVRFVRITWP